MMALPAKGCVPAHFTDGFSFSISHDFSLHAMGGFADCFDDSHEP
jgi:hypothetical protein